MMLRMLGDIGCEGSHKKISTSGKNRTIFSEMVVHANREISVDHLTEQVWGNSQPGSPTAALRVQISRLRAALRSTGPNAPEIVRSRSGFYSLRTDPASVDSSRFLENSSLVARLHLEERWDECRSVASNALDSWLGDPFPGVTESSCVYAARRELEEARADVLEHFGTASLRIGDPHGAARTIGSAVDDYPLRERLHELHLTALYRLGRAAEALDAYRKLCAVMDEELGVGPGPRLRELARRLSRAEPARHPGDPLLPHLRPPAPPAHVIGRDRECARLLGALGAQPSRVIVVHGMAGSGKTALALDAARRTAKTFPGGQAFLSLDRPGTSPTDPADPAPESTGRALLTLLSSLGVAEHDTPSCTSAASARLRSAIPVERTLLILDGAASASQIRPLLPGGDCTVIITSRSALPALEHVTDRIPVRPLGQADAVSVLTEIIGPERVGAEPDAAAALAQVCGGLPLALRIAAARLASRPLLPLSAMVHRLRGSGRKLTELELEDLSVRSSFREVYTELRTSADPARRLAARMLLLMGSVGHQLHDEQSLTGLLKVNGDLVRTAVEILLDVSMLEETRLENYRPHVLVLDFVRELARRQRISSPARG